MTQADLNKDYSYKFTIDLIIESTGDRLNLRWKTNPTGFKSITEFSDSFDSLEAQVIRKLQALYGDV